TEGEWCKGSRDLPIGAWRCYWPSMQYPWRHPLNLEPGGSMSNVATAATIVSARVSGRCPIFCSSWRSSPVIYDAPPGRPRAPRLWYPLPATLPRPSRSSVVDLFTEALVSSGTRSESAGVDAGRLRGEWSDVHEHDADRTQ